MEFIRRIHPLKILQHLRKRRLDGSKVHIATTYSESDIYMKFTENGLTIEEIDLACYHDGDIYILPFYKFYKSVIKRNEFYKDLCNIISHEFLHMFLTYTESRKTSRKLDNIAGYLEGKYTDCGGI